eukprot:354895-Chlamydomonas_euryale.AAC.3
MLVPFQWHGSKRQRQQSICGGLETEARRSSPECPTSFPAPKKSETLKHAVFGDAGRPCRREAHAGAHPPAQHDHRAGDDWLDHQRVQRQDLHAGGD